MSFLGRSFNLPVGCTLLYSRLRWSFLHYPCTGANATCPDLRELTGVLEPPEHRAPLDEDSTVVSPVRPSKSLAAVFYQLGVNPLDASRFPNGARIGGLGPTAMFTVRSMGGLLKDVREPRIDLRTY